MKVWRVFSILSYKAQQQEDTKISFASFIWLFEHFTGTPSGSSYYEVDLWKSHLQKWKWEMPCEGGCCSFLRCFRLINYLCEVIDLKVKGWTFYNILWPSCFIFPHPWWKCWACPLSLRAFVNVKHTVKPTSCCNTRRGGCCPKFKEC